MPSVVSATATKEQDSGSFGRKMALGIFASKTEEFLQVETRRRTARMPWVDKVKASNEPS